MEVFIKSLRHNVLIFGKDYKSYDIGLLSTFSVRCNDYITLEEHQAFSIMLSVGEKN